MTTTTTTPRFRFAPSPTGFLHVGGARTALVNWCLARKLGGVLILRIEDTDRERSSDEMVAGILDGMSWLGLDWDEGPFYQAERSDLATALADKVLTSGDAYRCYCTTDSLEKQRAEAEANGKPIFQYPGNCRNLDPAKTEGMGDKPYCVRFKVPRDETIGWNDIVHGESSVRGTEIEDFVLLRMDGTPTYHVAVVADDLDMNITHVVRGDDHLSNTPKQLLLYRAAGEQPPAFAHLPLILGPDKKKLSKRTGNTSVIEYRDQGYFPDAMFNFLALLGWSPGGDREVMDREEIAKALDFPRLNKSAAVFDTQKLDWLNQEHLQRLSTTDLLTLMRAGLEARGLWSDSLESDHRTWLDEVLSLLKPRARKVEDLIHTIEPFLTTSFPYDEQAEKKHLKGDDLADRLAGLRAALAASEPFDAATTETTIRTTAEQLGVGAGKLIHPIRVALTGQSVSPGIFEMLQAMGRDRSLQRIDRLIAHVKSRPI